MLAKKKKIKNRGRGIQGSLGGMVIARTRSKVVDSKKE
jgi:hypothetical protein